jgi:hypothetical protein
MSHRDTDITVRQNVTQEIWRRTRRGIAVGVLSLSLAVGYVGFTSNSASALQIAKPVTTTQQALMHPYPSCIGTPSDCH